jgi:hypothetical protein
VKETEVITETEIQPRSAVVVSGGALRTVVDAPVVPASLQSRLDTARARALPMLRYQVSRIGPLGLGGALFLLTAMILTAVMLIPAQRAVLGLKDQLAAASHMTRLPAQPSMTPHQFAGSLPTRAQIPALLGTVLTQAEGAGVSLDQGRYSFSPAAPNRLASYTFEFPIKGDYGSVRAFINKSLTAIPALGLEKLRIERKNVGDTSVHAEVAFIIYLRGA